MSAPLRVGLVGCGRLAQLGYLPALRQTEGVKLEAVADPDRARARRLAPGAAVHSGAAELVAAGGVDALVVASPPRAHLADARAGAEAGMAVLVEKPPAADVPGALALARLPDRVWVGFNRRCEPGMDELRRRAGGGPVRLELRLHYRRRTWNPHVVADDALLDVGPHVADLAGWLTGAEVTAARAGAVEPDRARFELLLDRGYARVDCATDRPHRELMAAFDPAGRPLGEVRRGGVAGLRARLRTGAAEHGLVPSLVAQLEQFARAARGGSPGPLATATQAAHVMAVLDAVRFSARDHGRWTAVTPARSALPDAGITPEVDADDVGARADAAVAQAPSRAGVGGGRH